MVFPQNLKRLKYNGKKVKDNHTVGYHNIQKEDTLHFMGRLRGGGKRGCCGGTTDANKDTRVKMLKDKIGTSVIRADTIPGVSPVVTELMVRFKQISQGVVLNPTHIFSEVLAILNVHDMLNMVVGMTSSNNLKARYHAIVDVVFKMYIERIDELRSQINKVESISMDIIELMFVTQYGDNSGNINWAELSKELACTIANKNPQSMAAGIGL